jgi:hypothetical protein
LASEEKIDHNSKKDRGNFLERYSEDLSYDKPVKKILSGR